MNYMKHYNDICNRGHERGTKKVKCFELHHIIPACYFKSRKIATYSENLCLLTPKEHYVVHHLLAKTGCPKMIFSFWRIVHCKSRDYYKITANEYELLRNKRSENLSKLMKVRIFTEEHRNRIREANKKSLKGNIPWNKGKTGVQTAWNKGLDKEKQPMFGRKRCPLSDEHKLKMSIKLKGRIPWNKGLTNKSGDQLINMQD